MADINPILSDTEAPEREPNGLAPEAEPLVELIELFFFAYRDFVGDPDAILAPLGFGRAHHRVLHFVNRHPGMRVTDLLDILRITKQSLGRVLRELVDEGFVESRAGASDRRQRLLFPTLKGQALAREFIALQSQRIALALQECGPGASEAAQRFLVAMIDPEDRAEVERLIQRAAPTARARPA
ncbi:MarR family transcriptional regulator [Xanthobacter sp. DSM 24535]|uniref:MarR family winged helix-turn-helix transcriptional regulator n=1 Tax=Roseixanthobacter psychrophilus TaxID=3119917 RepID=UPI00372B30D1